MKNHEVGLVGLSFLGAAVGSGVRVYPVAGPGDSKRTGMFSGISLGVEHDDGTADDGKGYKASGQPKDRTQAYVVFPAAGYQ